MARTAATTRTSPVRQCVNVTVCKDYLDQAREAGVNRSRVPEESLARLANERERRGLDEHREGIAEYNIYIENMAVSATPFAASDPAMI